MYSNSRRPHLKTLGAKTLAVGTAAALIAAAVPAAAFADYAPNNKTGKVLVLGADSDTSGLNGGVEQTAKTSNSVTYTGIAHSDGAHFSGYGLSTQITYNSKGMITAINLTSGNETWVGSWGYKNTQKAVDPIDGYLPDGVTSSLTANADGTYTPTLFGADSYGYAVKSTSSGRSHGGSGSAASGSSASSGHGGSAASGSSSASSGSSRGGSAASGSSSRGGSASSGTQAATTYAVIGYTATANGATEVKNGVSYDASTGKVTVNDSAVNVIKVTWTIGSYENIPFNYYYAIGTDQQKTDGNAYIDTVKATTWDSNPDLTDTMGDTNRNQWTAIMGTVYYQRMLASWSAALANNKLSSEIDDLDTVSGATKTAEPFVESLNQAVKDGYVKGVAEGVKVTIDKRKKNALDLNANPSDASTVSVDSDGNYVLSNDFPTGADRSQQHSVTIDSISTYNLGSNASTADILALAKGRSSTKALNTYTAKSVIGYEDDGDPMYSEGWGDFSDPDNKIAVKYASTGPVDITVKDKQVTHVAITYTLGHSNITLVYDLKQMKAAGDVKTQISKLTSKSSASAIKSARTAYNKLSYDVKGFVNNIGTLQKLEAKAAATKAANPMTVKGSTKTVKPAKLKKAKQTVKAITVKKAQGTVTYAKKSGSVKLTVNKKTGKVTVKKGTKKGTYSAKVTVKAAGNSKYKSASKTVTVKVKVKK